MASRVSLYKHDAERYPMYYGRTGKEYAIRPTIYKESSTTEYLAKELNDWIETENRILEPFSTEKVSHSDTKKLAKALRSRDGKAVTFSLFKGTVSHETEIMLRRRISVRYTEHYLAFFEGTIPTGLTPYFDKLSRGFPRYDICLFLILLQGMGLLHLLHENSQDAHAWWRDFVYRRGADPAHLALANAIQVTLISLGQSISGTSPEVQRARIIPVLKDALGPPDRARTHNVSDTFLSALESVNNIVRRLRKEPSFDEAWMINNTAPECDVLLVVATEIEREAVLELMPYVSYHEITQSYFHLGCHGGNSVYLVQCRMGSGTPGGSIQTTAAAIGDLRPKSVIMLGIAFGASHAQQIGDILVAQQVRCYEPQRIGTGKEGHDDIQFRGDCASASSRLLSRFQATTHGWDACKVHFGLLLSGEKLIDNQAFRDFLAANSTAIGGDMEAAGLYIEGVAKKVDWIVIKGVCDWADGHKQEDKGSRQQLAASNAARFVLRSLLLGPFGHG